MNRLCLGSLLLVWLSLFPGAAIGLAAARNIVLVVTDDLGLDLGCYGNPVVKTPHLDALARAGTLFRNAFATTASCSASRSVILTGLHNHANGHYGHQHSYHKFSSYDNVASLPMYLRAAGYRTARCGKYHVAPESVYPFEVAIPGNARNGVAMADNCRELIAADSERPFFLYFCTSDPHRSGAYAAESPERPNRFGNERAYPGIDAVEYDPAEVIVPPFLPDSAACRAELAEYYQSVSRVDQGVGRLVEHLEAAGILEETLFVFISDHGIAMPAAKTTVYEGGLRAPLLVRNPYVEARRALVADAMVSWVDLAPTLVDFAGALERASGRVRVDVLARLPRPELHASAQTTGATLRGEFHGRSFLALLDGQEERPGWNEVYASHTFHEIQMYYPMRVVRERRFKLIWNIAHPLPFPFASDLWAAPTWQAQYAQGPDARFGTRTVSEYIHRPEFELYDLKQDPFEADNLAGDEAHAMELERLTRKLKRFQERTGDPWIVKWEYE